MQEPGQRARLSGMRGDVMLTVYRRESLNHCNMHCVARQRVTTAITRCKQSSVSAADNQYTGQKTTVNVTFPINRADGQMSGIKRLINIAATGSFGTPIARGSAY